VSSGAALSETGVFSDRSGHNGDVAVTASGGEIQFKDRLFDSQNAQEKAEGRYALDLPLDCL